MSKSQQASKIVDGWLVTARQCKSPNFDQRPEGSVIDLLVVHGISLPPGEYGGPWIDDLFMNRLDPSMHPYFEEIKGLEVSTHVLIRRDGERVQYVDFNARAWHAGKSCFDGRTRCNDYSIGIELEGTDEAPYETVQYECLAMLACGLMRQYPGITPNRIVGHSDIAPGRKTDPGPSFDWGYFRQLVKRFMETQT